MGERTILVCDVCGRPAVQTVTIKVGRQNWAKDLCQTHIDEMTAGARKPRPGRRRAVVTADVPAAPKRRGRPPKSAATGGPPRRRGRPRKTETAAAPAASESSSS